MLQNTISRNLKNIYAEIKEAERKSLRQEGSVKLCAVSKFHPVESVFEAINEGQILFGENRVQEAYAKFNAVKEANKTFELHIIGALQLNKVKKAVEIASCIESVDREDVLIEIEKHCAKLNKQIQVYFELHTGEDTKSGYADEASLFSSIEHCANGAYPHIVPTGLMTMAPFTDDESAIRKSFASLRLLKEKINKQYPLLPIKELSMGMSGDFKIAIEEGSTQVRVGTALFGSRINKEL